MDRIPPHSIDAEQCVLGAVMLDQEARNKAMRLLTSGDFFLEKHRKIWDAVVAVGECDLTTVMDRLDKGGFLDKAGGIEYLCELTGTVLTTQSITAHANIVLEKSQYRKFISAAERIADIAYNQETPVLELKGVAFELLDIKLSSQLEGIGMADATGRFKKLLDERKLKRGGDVKVGLPWLDSRTHGLFPGNSIILAARPSVGKTTLGVQIAKFNAYRGKKVLLYSLEMTDMQLIEKMVSNDAYVNSNLLKLPAEMMSDEKKAVEEAIVEISTLNMTIFDNVFTIEEIVATAKQQKAEHGVDLVLIDYLQIVQTNRKFGTNNERIGYFSMAIKQLAKGLNCPIITISQLRRPPEGVNHQPTLVDLRDSGNIEQDADVVLLLHDPNAGKLDTGNTDLKCIIAKQREGERDVGHMFRYQKAQQRILEEER